MGLTVSGESPIPKIRKASEVKSEFSSQRSWAYIVRAAEGGEEVVERVLVGKVDGLEACAPLVFVAVEEIVIANGCVEEIPGSDSCGIVVRVLRVRRRDLHKV